MILPLPLRTENGGLKTSLAEQWLELGVHQERVVKFGHFAPALAKNRQQPRRKRFVPFHRQARHVPDNQRKLLGADVPRQRNGVQARAAHGRVTEQRIDGNESFSPALRQPRIFQDWQHQSGVARLLHFDVLDRRRNRRRRRQRSAHSERVRRQILDGRTDGNVLQRRGRQIDSYVRPPGCLIYSSRVLLDVIRACRQRIRQSLLGRRQIRSIVVRRGNHIRGFQRDGELVPEAGVIRARKERRQRRHHGNRRKTEITLAVWRARFQFFHHPGGSAYRGPMHAIFARYHQARIQHFRVAQDFRNQVGLLFAVACVQHRRTDRRVEFFLRRQRVVLLEKRHRLLLRQSLRVLRKRLSGNANRFDFVSARFKDRLRSPQHFQRVRHLHLVLRPIQIDKRRNRPDLRLLLCRRGFLLRANNSAAASHGHEQHRERTAQESSQSDGRWTHWSMLLVGAQHAAPH